MFTPRIPEGAEIGEGKHEIVVLAGAPLDFEALEIAGGAARSETGERLSNALTQAAENAGVSTADGAANSDDWKYEPKTRGLKSFLLSYKDFRAADWY